MENRGVERPLPIAGACRYHMRIGIIGAAGMGSTLARNLARLGHDVSYRELERT